LAKLRLQILEAVEIATVSNVWSEKGNPATGSLRENGRLSHGALREAEIRLEKLGFAFIDRWVMVSFYW
jgi:hypothetical protein